KAPPIVRALKGGQKARTPEEAVVLAKVETRAAKTNQRRDAGFEKTVRDANAEGFHLSNQEGKNLEFTHPDTPGKTYKVALGDRNGKGGLNKAVAKLNRRRASGAKNNDDEKAAGRPEGEADPAAEAPNAEAEIKRQSEETLKKALRENG